MMLLMMTGGADDGVDGSWLWLMVVPMVTSKKAAALLNQDSWR